MCGTVWVVNTVTRIGSYVYDEFGGIKHARLQGHQNFAGRGEDGGLHICVPCVNRRDALVNVGFAHARDAKLARNQPHARREVSEARFHLCGEHCF